MTALEQLGAFVAQSDAQSAGLRETLELHVVDTIGAWLASTRTAEGAALLRWRRALRDAASGPFGPAHPARLDVATHCALARMSEIDDIHLASTTTPGAIVVPGAIAAATALASRDPAPATLAAAMVVGYEVMVRLGQAIDGAAILYRGIWPTYFTAPAGMAAAAVRLLGLDARQAAHALALALTRAAPGVGHHGAATTARWLAIGQAAEAGLVAALAARAGFTSDLALLDSGYLARIYDIRPNTAGLTAGLGERFALPEVSLKPWCAARQTMAATQALIEIVGSGVPADSIAHVKAFVLPPHRAMVDHGVTAGDRASFLTSLPYRMAVAAVAPQAAFEVGQAPQAPAQVAEPIRDFMGRIAIEPDDALLADYPRHWPARVEAATLSGRHVRSVTHVPGDPARPCDAAAVQGKFRRFVEPALGAAAAATLLQQALGLLSGQTAPAELLKEIEQVVSPSPEGGGSDRRRRYGVG
jgi:2-methylcitrate dehydratase PrpD